MSDLPPLKYSRPGTLAEVLTALQSRAACIYAGGTDLLVALNQRQAWVRSVRTLVDIKDLAEAKGITDLGAELRIGSLTTAEQLAGSSHVRRYARVLAEAAEQTSAPLLRARGTVGGNLATPHPAGDMTTALLALDATVELAEPSGLIRDVPVADLVSRRSGRSTRRTLIVAIRVPKCRRSAFEKLGVRRTFSRSLVAVAVVLHPDGVRVAIGGMGERPFLARKTSAALEAGDVLTAALYGGTLAARLRLAEVLIERARARAARS
jgi:carbon-monoxide dehydrogenase medium subunit